MSKDLYRTSEWNSKLIASDYAVFIELTNLHEEIHEGIPEATHARFRYTMYREIILYRKICEITPCENFLQKQLAKLFGVFLLYILEILSECFSNTFEYKLIYEFHHWLVWKFAGKFL